MKLYLAVFSLDHLDKTCKQIVQFLFLQPPPPPPKKYLLVLTAERQEKLTTVL